MSAEREHARSIQINRLMSGFRTFSPFKNLPFNVWFGVTQSLS